MGKKYNNKYKEYYINKLILYMISIFLFILANLYTSIDIKANECQEDENLNYESLDPTIQVHPDIFRPPIVKKKYKKITRKYLDNICIDEYEYHKNGYTINYTIYNNDEIISYGYDEYDNFGNLIIGELHYTNPNTNSKEINKEVHEYNNYGKETKVARYTISEYDGSILESDVSTIEYDNLGKKTKTESARISRVYPYENATYTVCNESTASTIFEYDDNNKIVKETFYINNSLLGYDQYEYDNNGFLIKKTSFSPNGTISGILTYEYDENNNCIKRSSINGYETYEYDNKGNRIKRILYSNNNKTLEETYEYDSNGFEIKYELHTNDADTIRKREIEYDNDGDLKTAVEYDNSDYYKDYNGISYIIEYEYFDETPPENIIVSSGTITTTGIYCASNYPSIQAGINVQKGNLADTVEYRWVACNNKNPDQWFEVSPWTRDNNWINWTPEESGGYVFVCYARVVGNEEESMIQSSFGTEYHKQIKGICQMPYAGPGGGYLIGIESYDNPNHSYKYEMLILDCNLYMQGKDAWVYTTGKCGAPENCLWTIWQPQYGYYWTLFRIYDANDNLIDEACYGFENIY